MKLNQRFVSLMLAVAILLLMLPSTALETSAASSNADIIFEYMVGTLGLKHAAACGVLANIQCESNFNPTAGF